MLHVRLKNIVVIRLIDELVQLWYAIRLVDELGKLWCVIYDSLMS